MDHMNQALEKLSGQRHVDKVAVTVKKLLQVCACLVDVSGRLSWTSRHNSTGHVL